MFRKLVIGFIIKQLRNYAKETTTELDDLLVDEVEAKLNQLL